MEAGNGQRISCQRRLRRCAHARIQFVKALLHSLRLGRFWSTTSASERRPSRTTIWSDSASSCQSRVIGYCLSCQAQVGRIAFILSCQAEGFFRIVYGRPRMFGNRPKSGKHKKRMCCVMDDGSLEPTSNHNYTVWKEVTRLMGCTICAPRYPPNTRISNKFRIKDDLNPPPPPQLPPPGAPAQYQPPAQGTQLTHLVPRDGGSSNDIRNSGIAGIRAGGQRPAHNVHPASLARVRILEGNSRNAGPWQNRVQGTYFNNHLHKRATN